jgi:lipoate-protein ligase A
MPLFNLLAVFSDATPRDGAGQMALDEALLETCKGPILRVYLWDKPAVSFGYSQSLTRVREAFPGLPLVRRWTGGGMVEHGCDWTFSLIIPAGEPFASVRPAESYRRIHAVIAAALGSDAVLQEKGSGPAPAGACFVQPVRDDILAFDGRKICGGAQRRTRKGLLHQGSVQNCVWPADFVSRVVSGLAVREAEARVEASVGVRAAQLAAEKYGSAAWREKIP